MVQIYQKNCKKCNDNSQNWLKSEIGGIIEKGAKKMRIRIVFDKKLLSL
jgi:hypothetical protein